VKNIAFLIVPNKSLKEKEIIVTVTYQQLHVINTLLIILQGPILLIPLIVLMVNLKNSIFFILKFILN